MKGFRPSPVQCSERARSMRSVSKETDSAAIGLWSNFGRPRPGETPGHYDILVLFLAVANRGQDGLDQHAFVQGLAQIGRRPGREA